MKSPYRNGLLMVRRPQLGKTEARRPNPEGRPSLASATRCPAGTATIWRWRWIMEAIKLWPADFQAVAECRIPNGFAVDDTRIGSAAFITAGRTRTGWDIQAS